MTSWRALVQQDERMNVNPLMPDGFAVIFGVFVVIIALGFVFVIFSIVKNARKAAELGHDPLTMQTELAAKAIDSQALSPARTVEQRLAEADGLLAAGTISPDEHAAARARILGTL